MFYVCGNSFSEINEKISKLYLKNYWDEHKSLTGTTATMQKYGRTAENSIKLEYSDDESLGRKRSWVSQLKYCEPHIRNKNKILENIDNTYHCKTDDIENIQQCCKKKEKAKKEKEENFLIIYTKHIFRKIKIIKLRRSSSC